MRGGDGEGRYLLTRPDRLKDHQREHIEAARAACHEMTALAELIHNFAVLLDPTDGNAALLSTWITSARAEDLPHLHAFTRELARDRAAVDAALTLPHHNGGTEVVNNKTKLMSSSRGHRSPRPSQNRT
ncbi:transposase [Streptomyces sp. NPDC048277]|uniref:transposase n=1 Tax=Streptomyces sp. NPDC048277 TaxID=3155027 RepID=UPI0033EA9475